MLNDDQAEIGMLAYLLHRPPELVRLGVDASDFAPGFHRDFFRAIELRIRCGETLLDAAVLRADLVAKGKRAPLAEILSILSLHAVGGGSLLRVLRKARLRREGQRIFAEATAKLALETADGEAVLAGAARELEDVLLGVRDEPPVSHATLLGGPDVTARRLRTGFPSLDRRIGGFPLPSLVIVGGRTSRGKTAFMQQLAEQAASRGERGLLCSLEMAVGLLRERSIARQASISLSSFADGSLTLEESGRRARAMPFSGLFVSDKAPQTPEDIVRMAERLAQEGPLRLVVVDYVQLLQLRPQGRALRYELIAEAAAYLKAAAGKLGACFLVAAQLSRKAEEEEPALHHLRECGDLEHHADLVLLLGGKEPAWPDLIVAKNRQGPIGRFQMRFEGEFARFTDAGT